MQPAMDFKSGIMDHSILFGTHPPGEFPGGVIHFFLFFPRRTDFMLKIRHILVIFSVFID